MRGDWRERGKLDGLYEWISSFIIIVWKFGLGLVVVHSKFGGYLLLCGLLQCVVCWPIASLSNYFFEFKIFGVHVGSWMSQSINFG